MLRRAFTHWHPTKNAIFPTPLRTSIRGSLIYPGLYQGEAPPCGPLLSQAGFDTIVLCAEEWQPPEVVDPMCASALNYQPGRHPYPGVTLVLAPAKDDFLIPPSRGTLALALKAASYVAQRVAQGGKVLVSCWAGKNRSGLVTTLALHKLTGRSGIQCMAMIRIARPEALTNPQFCLTLSKISPCESKS